MSDLDWQSFFVDLKTKDASEGHAKAAWSIFDSPEKVQQETAKPSPSTEKKVPPKKKEEPSKEKSTKGKWDEFLGLFYEEGKKKVKNPNLKTKDQYPEVAFETAMKDQSFAGLVQKQYQAWLQQGAPAEEAPFKAGDFVVDPTTGDKLKVVGVEPNQYGGYKVKVDDGDGSPYVMNSEFLKKFEEDDEKKGEGDEDTSEDPFSEVKVGDVFYEEGVGPDQPHTVVEIKDWGDEKALLADDGIVYYSGEVELGDDGKVKTQKEEPKAQKKPAIGTVITSLDDIVPGIFIKNQWVTVGKVTSMLPDGGFRYREFNKMKNDWGSTHKIPKDQAEKYFSDQKFTVVGDPKEEVPKGSEVVKGDQVSSGDTVWVKGEPHVVKQVEEDEDKHGNKFLLDDGDWVNMHDVDKPDLPGAHSWLYHKEGEPKPSFAYGDVAYLSDGTKVKTQVTKKPDKEGIPTQVELPDGSSTWVYEKDLSTEQPKPKKAEVGDKITSPAQLEEGDFIQSVAEDAGGSKDPYVGKITEVHGSDEPLGAGVYLQDYDPKSGKLLGKPWWLAAKDLDDGHTTKVKSPKVKKGLTGTEIKDPKKLKSWDVLRVHEYGSGKVYTAQVVQNDDGWIVYNIVNPKTGKTTDTRTVSPQAFADELQVARLPKSKIPKKLKKDTSGDKDPFLLVQEDSAKAEIEKAKSEQQTQDLKEDVEHPVPQPKKPKGKAKKVDKSKWKLKTETVDWDDVGPGDMIHTKEYGPQRVVSRSSTGVRLESGVTLSKGKLKKAQGKYTISRGDKPQKAKLPDAPARPKGTAVESPDQVKDGDVIEYEHGGVTYRGKVVSWDEPGKKFRVRITYPPSYVQKYESYDPSTGQKTFKTPSFDQAKIDKRKPRILTSDQMKEYDQEVKKYTEKIKKIDQQYADDVAEYEAAMAGNTEVYTGALQNVQPPKDWNHGSTIARDADRFFQQYKEIIGDKVKSIVDDMTPGKTYYRGTSSMWDELSEGERKLAQSGHHAAEEFRRLLTPEEWSAWQSALSDWQGSSGGSEAHRLMGGLENLGVEGGPKSFEASNVQHYREEGRKNEALHRAVSKAMAYSQLVYDMLDVDHISLYRGTKTKPVVGAPQGKKIKTNTARELASFSIDPQVAYSFAGGDDKRVVRYRVPVSRLFISPVTYANLSSAKEPYSENEYVVAGQDGMEGRVMPEEMDDFDTGKMKVAHERRPLFGPVFDEDALLVDFSEEDDAWLRSPIKDSWWPQYCHSYDHLEEENMPRRAARSIMRLASKHRGFRREFIAVLHPRGSTTSIFDTPKTAVSIFDAPSSVEPSSPQDKGFEEWFSAKYEGGTKKVPNPNSETKERYPEVSASTAMKNKSFSEKVHAEYQQHKAEKEKAKTPMFVGLPPEAKASWKQWQKEHPDAKLVTHSEENWPEDAPFKKGDSVATPDYVGEVTGVRYRKGVWEFKIDGMEWEPEGSLTPPTDTAEQAIKDVVESAWSDWTDVEIAEVESQLKEALGEQYSAEEHLVRALEPLLERSQEMVDDLKSDAEDEDLPLWEREVSALERRIKELTGKVPQTPSDLNVGELIRYKYKDKEMIGKVVSSDGDVFRALVYHPVTGKKLRTKPVSFDSEKMRDREVERAEDWSPQKPEKAPPKNDEGSPTDSDEVLDLDSGAFKQVGPQKGSNPGGLYEAEDGTRYYVKTPKSRDRAQNEILASKLYELAGVDVPKLSPATLKGKHSVASRIVPGLSSDSSALRKGEVSGILEGIAADAWLGNWDVVGLDYDNLLVDEKGKGLRVDTGGSLRYRAAGTPKGEAFGDEVKELKVLTDPGRKSGSVFHHASPRQIVDSIDRVLEIPEGQIRKLVDEWGPKGAEKDKLFQTLMARRKSLQAQRAGYVQKLKEKEAAVRVLQAALRDPRLGRALAQKLSL